jgi:PAS domain S-box-containing protein
MALGGGLALSVDQPWTVAGAAVFSAGLLLLVGAALGAARRQRVLLANLAEAAQRLRGSPSESPAVPLSPLRAAEELSRAASLASDRIQGLQATERDLRAMFDAVDAAVVASDHAGVVILCNRAAGEFVGRPGAILIGRRIEELLTQADLIDLHSSARDGHAHSRQVRLQRPQGAREFEVFVSPLPRAAAAPGVVMTLRDVTDLARSAQVKTDFVVNASHEMRTPIAALRMAAETLEGGAASDPVMLKRLLAVISGHVGRLEDLTHDLMDLSRLESPDLSVTTEPVPAADLAEELGQLFADACRQRALTLAFQFDPALEAMQTDRNLVLLILKNLIDNATKFADAGSTVRVVGRPITGDAGAARFEVIDQGLGIPLNQQDRVFERFYQIDAARSGGPPGVRRGTGLGLAIVKHAVRTLGGQVRVQSVWKQGTTMIVELPGVLPGPDLAQRTLR